MGMKNTNSPAVACLLGTLAAGAVFRYRFPHDKAPPTDGFPGFVKIDALYARGIRDGVVGLNALPGEKIAEIPVWFLGFSA